MNNPEPHPPKGNILIVDDTLPNLHLLSNMLTDYGYKVRGVSNGQMAVTVVNAAPPDLILLDIRMPGMNGYQVCHTLKSNQQTADIPIIFLSALDEAMDKVKAFTCGGVDYITKPFQLEEVLIRVETHLTLRRLQSELQAANQVLEQRVEERTAELMKTIVILEEQITERRQAEKARSELEQKLHESQKMEALGQLAGGVAHDFNNLLTIIIGYTGLLLKHRLADDDPTRKEVAEIQRAGVQAANLTNQLLAFSRRQMLQPKVIDLNQVITEVETMLRRLIGENIHFMTILEPDLGRVRVDMGQMEQVIINLVINARDAMPRGGTLTITSANATVDEAEIEQHLQAKPGDFVRLTVSDTGIGMDAATQARIFEPFFTTKAKGEGTGLGLATVHGIISQSDGYLTVDSAPNQGATFNLYLPRVEAEVDRQHSHPDVVGSLNGTETILLVEDEKPVRQIAHQILQWQGYTILEADHGDEALLICEQYHGPIHLLITDVIMPQLSGPELAERLTLLRPECKVIYMSGYAGEAIAHYGVLTDGATFLQKPFSQEGLTKVVRKVLDNE